MFIAKLRFFRSAGRRRALYALATLLAVLVVLALYERPAHHYDTSYESCWRAAVAAVITSASPHTSGICTAPPGTLLGVGRLAATEPMITSKDHTLVLFATGEGTDYAGLAYVVRETPPPDTCVTPLGGPWWEFRSGTGEGNCPRGYTFQPAP